MTPDDRKRAIGKVISVAADKFIIELHGGTDNFTVVGFDDMHYVARLGSFLMIPVHTEYVVAEIVGLREKDPTTSRDDDRSVILDKASSAKFLDVVPVGMLSMEEKGKFRFGVSTYPSLYADALYARDEELDRIFDVEDAEEKVPLSESGTPPDPANATRYKAVGFGTSVVFQGYEVKVRIEDFFGGHAAVLGNTGSGKSCTVASILQSIFEKRTEHKARGATFVVFDVNGEYTEAFSKLEERAGIKVKTLVLDGTSDAGAFRLPHWFLDLSEWELLLQASEKTQIPVLRNALGLTSMLTETTDESIKAHFVAKCILECLHGADGDSPVSKMQRVHALLSKYATTNLNVATLTAFGYNAQYGNFTNHNGFITHVKGHVRDDIRLPAYSGTAFNFTDLIECLDFAILYEEAHGNRQIRDYCASMLTRLHALGDRSEFDFLKADARVPIIGDTFLKEVLGIESSAQRSRQDQIIIIDMNAVEDEVVELVSAVIARMVFKLLRRASPRNAFPVHFILEEAHRYIAEKPSRYAVEASRIFERIAKEGRKYGAFLVVASQRPSELSRTVLSQCSNFVVHRIQNPEDLTHIRQMTPFISEAVLKRLPSLPKQHALVFGNAVNLPTTFKVRSADPLPASHDTKIRELWFRNDRQPKILPVEAEEHTSSNMTPMHPEVDLTGGNMEAAE